MVVYPALYIVRAVYDQRQSFLSDGHRTLCSVGLVVILNSYLAVKLIRQLARGCRGLNDPVSFMTSAPKRCSDQRTSETTRAQGARIFDAFRIVVVDIMNEAFVVPP